MKKGEIELRIKDILGNMLRVIPNDIKTHDDAKSLGMDSLDQVEAIMKIEEDFFIAIPDEEAEKLTSVAKYIDYVYRVTYET